MSNSQGSRSGLGGLGRTASFQGKVSSCWEKTVSFPGRKVSSGRGGIKGSLTAYCIVISLDLVTSFPRGKESAYLSVSLGCVITFLGGSTSFS